MICTAEIRPASGLTYWRHIFYSVTLPLTTCKESTQGDYHSLHADAVGEAKAAAGDLEKNAGRDELS